MITVRYSEVNELIDCEARWDFRYRGQRAGTPLKPKVSHNRLNMGSAFGLGAFALHSGETISIAENEAGRYMAEQIIDMDKKGIPYDMDEQQECIALVYRTLQQHDRIATKLNLTDPEKELECVVNGVKFLGHIDGIHTDASGNKWIVDFKMRSSIYELWYVYFLRQLRWYSYFAREMGMPIVGFIYDESLSEFPSPIRYTGKGALDERYTYSMADLQELVDQGKEVSQKLLTRAEGKRYHSRHELMFSEGDYEDIKNELFYAAVRVRDFYGELGSELYAMRNPNTNRCPGCAFKDICFEPNPQLWLDLYDKWDNPNLSHESD